MDAQTKKAVYTIVERPDGDSKKSFWVRIGIAFLNRDGSYNVKLDALPMNGTLQVRDWPPPNEWPRRESNAPANTNGGRSHADIFAGGA
jgi:hypothetical protein